MRTVRRGYRSRRSRSDNDDHIDQPINIKSAIGVAVMTICVCLVSFALWYGYPYHFLQFNVEKSDIDQKTYSHKLLHMHMHPKYDKWMRRHNRVNDSNPNISSINNGYGANELNDDTNPNEDLKEIQKEEKIILEESDEEIIIEEKKDEDILKTLFMKYLEPLCIKTKQTNDILSLSLNKDKDENGDTSLPSDCNDLLWSMINITQAHKFSQNEVDLLVQRIEYLMNIRPQNGKYLFIHIPHTAIQSLIENIIKPNFDGNDIYHYNDEKDDDLKDLLVRPEIENIDKLKIVYGHLPFGFDKLFISEDDVNDHSAKYVLTIDELQSVRIDNEETQTQVITEQIPKDLWINRLNFTYYTILRDPIDFIVGNYYGLSEEEKETYRDLDDFIENKLNRNIMTKFICGNDIKTWYTPNSHHQKLSDFIANGNDYYLARINLISMGWIGLFHDLDESVKQLQYLWKLDDNKNMKLEMNKNFDKPFNIKLTQNQREIILKRNKWDVMLYELALVLQKQQQIVLKYMS